MRETLAERIQAAMEMRDMSQADLVRATGMYSSQINHIVSGRTKDPGFMEVVKIARALDVSLNYLAGWKK